MLSRRYLVLFALGIFCASGASFAEPQADERARDRNQTWGDPEDHAEPDPGWTWFGMGYENRARTSVRSAERQGGAASGRPGGQGKGKGRKK